MTLSGHRIARCRAYLCKAGLASSLTLLFAQGVPGQNAAPMLNLPSSKELGAVPGNPQRVNSLPTTMVVSPDGRYVVTVNAGYGTFESRYLQSLAVMDTRTGKVTDFPDDRTRIGFKQTLYSGLAFSRDGRHVYASMASASDPEGDGKTLTGSGVLVYGFSEGRISPERMIPIPLQKLAGARRTKLAGGGVDGRMGVPYPAAIAVTQARWTGKGSNEDAPLGTC